MGGVTVGGILIDGLDVGSFVGVEVGVSVNANFALHPVNSKQVWPGVEQSEESVEKQGREQSLAASTQEGPQ